MAGTSSYAGPMTERSGTLSITHCEQEITSGQSH